MQRGVTDACAHRGAKGACWEFVLCMLVLALANARRSAHQMHTLLYRLNRSTPSGDDRASDL